MSINSKWRIPLCVVTISLATLGACGGGGDGTNGIGSEPASDAASGGPASGTAAPGANAAADDVIGAGAATGDSGRTGGADDAGQAKPGATAGLDTVVAGDAVSLPPPSKPHPDGTIDSPKPDALDKVGDVDVIRNGFADSDTSAIAGFWDFSTTEGKRDVLYEWISRDGRITYFDWDNDDFGTGRECFHVETRRFTSLGDDRYSFDGSVLAMRVVDEHLVVDDGQGQTHRFPERLTIDTSMLPRCG